MHIRLGIPEEESGSEHCESASKSSSKRQQRATPSSGQGGSSATKSRKSQRCTGCPGCCSESPRQLPVVLPALDLPNHGENKVRAWLEDVRSPQRRWGDIEDTRRNFQENARTFARNLEYLKMLARRDFVDSDDRASLAGKSVSSWKDNPPMLRTFQNITARSEILENDDRHSVSRRSTRSMFEETERDRYKRGIDGMYAGGDDAINAKVRKAIENSFLKQMEEDTMKDVMKENKDDKDAKDDKSEDESTAKTEGSSGDTGRSAEESPRPLKPNVGPRRSRKSKAPDVPSPKKKELPDMINELPGAKNTARRIMDAVIREMVDVKALDYHHDKSSDGTTIHGNYEVDSLERSKCSRKSSTSPDQSSMDNQSSPALSTALPMDEELTMQNAVINTRTGEMTMSKLNGQVLAERSCYIGLPELISGQRAEAYSLVSEVYVNDGYASPACSDDSGPEIQYEPENPGHLTIKVQDSPENYVKLDESEYEPDTLDRKPMKLRINEDMRYDHQEISNEVFVDSLERPAQILLRSKGSFRDEDSSALQCSHGSLREIYEAKIRTSLKFDLPQSEMIDEQLDGTLSWKKCRYLTPDSRQAKRQRQPHNQPDVVPLPPTEEIYQRPKPPRRVEDAKLSPSPLQPTSPSKNVWDRSLVEAGDPTASNGAPVPKTGGYHVGNRTCHHASQTQVRIANDVYKNQKALTTDVTFLSQELDDDTVTNDCQDCPCKTRIEIVDAEDRFYGNVDIEENVLSREMIRENRPAMSSSHKNFSRSTRMRSWNVDHHREDEDRLIDSNRAAQSCSRTRQLARSLSRNYNDSGVSRNAMLPLVEDNQRNHMKIEDSGYLSSTDSNGSHKRLLRHEVSSVSEETDETESVCDGASESGAESIGTDSVFFGNFRRLSEMSKSADSGVDLAAGNPTPCYQPLFVARNDTAAVLERGNFSTSDSETESLVTVLPPCKSQCNSLISQSRKAERRAERI